MDSQNQARLTVLACLVFCLASTCLPISAQQPARTAQPPVPSVQRAPATQRPRVASGNELDALLKAGQAAQEQGRLDESILIYNRVIVLATNSPKTAAFAYVRIGNAHLSQRKFDNATLAFKQATTLDSAWAEAHNNLGEALGELKQYRQAIESFNRAVAIDPKLLKARYNIGITYGRMGNQKYSEFVFRNLIKSNPDYSLAYDGLAVTLSKAGRAKEAIPFHERAIALSPQDPYYYYNLAMSYLTLGDTAKALEQQQRLTGIDPRVADHLASVIVKRRM